MSQPEDKFKDLFIALRAWGWPNLFARFRANFLLITDADFLEVFRTRVPALRCATAQPGDAYGIDIPDGIDTVVIFLREGELALAREMRRRYPALKVISALYDLAPKSAVDIMALPSYPESMPTNNGPMPGLLLSQPGSDSEYLIELMKTAGLGSPVEYIGQPLVALLNYVQEFSLATFARNVRRLHGAASPFWLHLQTDVLQTLAEKSRAGSASIFSYLRRCGFQTVLFTRQDKLTQCVQARIFGNRRIRSMWQIPPAQRPAFIDRHSIGFTSALDAFEGTSRYDRLMDEASRQLGNTIEIELEALALDPQATVKRLAEFLDRPAPADTDCLPYLSPIDQMPAVGRIAREFRAELIDRLGLHLT